MRLTSEALRLSASDLAAHLGCRHLTELEHLTARGALAPPSWADPMLEVLQQRGFAHEEAYLAHLKSAQGLEVERLDEADEAFGSAFERTCDAMRRGVGAIAQATLMNGRWHGRADVLRRVELPSTLGSWSYIPVDTKLAAETRGGTVLQLCLYAELVAAIQGALPAEMHVISPGAYDAPEVLRTRDYLAFYRLVRARLEAAVAAEPDPERVYPEPVAQCDICRWWPRCNQRRRDDDHLSLVAGASRLQRRELEGRGLSTVAQLAGIALPLTPGPRRGSKESYERIHHQARIQLASRGEPRPRVEVLEPIEPGFGLARVPEPSPGDIFLDLEGDAFVEGGGREYLFGWVLIGEDGEPQYESRWGVDPAGERAAYESFIDEAVARWDRFPDLHIYHFHSYEPSALKRLMGRYGSREAELDRLLRGERLVDLHAVVKQALRIGIERYGLKELEAVHGFERQLDLRQASGWLRGVERALELGEPDAIADEARAAVEAYNRDDCVSTLRLRDWLEGVRAEQIAGGAAIPRPEPKPDEPAAALKERAQRIQALFDRLSHDVPEAPEARTPEQGARFLLAHLLDWHRREDKVTFWEKYRLRDLAPEDLRDEKSGLGRLTFVKPVGGTATHPVHRYSFPEQDQDVRPRDQLFLPGHIPFGKVEAVDLARRTVNVKKRGDTADLHPDAVYAWGHFNTDAHEAALERLATWVADNGIDAPGPLRAARDLLLRTPPRVATAAGGSLCDPTVELRDEARRIVRTLGEGVLPVQGPPGSGKTYIGARMICEMLKQGRKVGVTAVSHKVIRNLLDAVVEAAGEEGLAVRCVQKPREVSSEPPAGIQEVKTYAEIDAELAREGGVVVGAISWAWVREPYREALDVLVIDEAGQMSLANACAVSQAAPSLILLGDPQQLEQPIRGTHPEGSDISALEHLLGSHETLPDELGLFLDETWRLHADICAFTSEQFYEERLSSRPVCNGQAITGPTPIAGTGLWLSTVEHQGNQSSSPEEVERIGEIVEAILVQGVGWTDVHGATHPLRWCHVLVVAPYNAQVARIQARLPQARVGTVDKFQGQEAPVVVYSTTTSSAEDAPRGMEFLYSRHRLNVASSRARCACIVVANPRLLEPECRTPRQMRLANALCRYAELARPLVLGS